MCIGFSEERADKLRVEGGKTAQIVAQAGALVRGAPRDGSGQPTDKAAVMMMIAFITIKSSLAPLIEGLCAQIYFRFEISVVCSHLLLFFFVKEKTC